ncbi:hypothetical protein L2735_13675 [Shewanella olleyana]|uniref:hypothetical protein n=1 Tax=Shewanella olleyana TaxID=135626 RepID=UPI00200BFC13|nr:hypothetical protein [Shewanella olleyana]MCL1067841.1 hypothetical protein [Shewanella olleyana]
MKKPTWGNQISAHAKQGEIALNSMTLTALSAVKLIFAFKKVWFAVFGYSIYSNIEWSWLTNITT